ncbi:MAG: TonB-dependent receptor [Pseudomonadota bacterium]
MTRKRSCILTSLCVAIASGSVKAQVLEEVIVSATQRQESLQDVPVSVAAVTGETLNNMGVVDIEEVALYVPNFEASISTILPNLYVRGLGTGTSHSIEQPVGRFVDDVYIGRGAASILSFMDTASVEILRGPQGTLFGKNTLAGAMIIRTGAPTDTLEGNVSVNYGSYDTNGNFGEVEAYVAGPITDSVRGRVAVRYADSDGYIENRANGPDGGIREDFGIRLKLEADLGSNSMLELKFEHGELEAEGNTSNRIVAPPENAPGLANVFRSFSPGWTEGLDWTTDYACESSGTVTPNLPGFCPQRDQEVQAAVARFTHDFAAGEFLSITAFQTYEFIDQFFAIDMGIAGGAYNAHRDEDFESLTQEFRFTSETSGNSDYIIGLYLEDTDLTRFSPTDINFNQIPGVPLAVQQWENFDQNTQTLAIFGQYRYRFTDRLTASLGARWTTEEKEFSFERYYQPYGSGYSRDRVPFPDGPFGPLEAAVNRPDENRDESRFTPSLNVQYDISDTVMVYGTISQGYKAGGFSDRVSADPDFEIQFEEELNNSIEFGMKGLFLDGAMELNLAIFHMQIEDLQVSSSVPGTVAFQVQNAADAISQGVELDGRWSVSDNLMIGGNMSYLDAFYDSFPDAPCTPGQSASSPGGCTQDLEDQPLIFAPEWKGTLFAEYTMQFAGGWELLARGDATYSADFYTETPLSPGTFQESYEVYNAALWFTSPSEQLRLGVVGRNLGNEAYRRFGLASPGSSIYLAEPNLPRRYSFALQYNF